MKTFILGLVFVILSGGIGYAGQAETIKVTDLPDQGTTVYLMPSTMQVYVWNNTTVIEAGIKFIYDEKGKKIAYENTGKQDRYKDIAYSEHILAIKPEKNLFLVERRTDYNSKGEIIVQQDDEEDEWDEIKPGTLTDKEYSSVKQVLAGRTAP